MADSSSSERQISSHEIMVYCIYSGARTAIRVDERMAAEHDTHISKRTVLEQGPV